jgi:hypothetical protein
MPDRRPWWATDPVDTTTGGTGRQSVFAAPPTAARVPPRQPSPEESRALYERLATRSYRRATPSEADDDGFVWIEPSATVWPNVKGNPPGPRTRQIGYNISERTVRCIFRDGTKWRYDDVPPDVWERIRRTASTGRFIARVLDGFPYGPDSW